MKILEGQLVETNYAWPASSPTVGGDGDENGTSAEPMARIAEHYLEKDTVTYINGNIGLLQA